MHWIDPDFLPETVGRVDRFLVNPHGEPDGMMLADGTEVHVPPHLGAEMVRSLRPGGLVKIRGVRPRGVAMVAAVAFESEDGRRTVDRGPPKGHKERREADRDAHEPPAEMEIAGVVGQVLHGPKGEPRGVLLADGSMGRFPTHAAGSLDALLRPGAPVAMRGEARVTEHGTVVSVRRIGPDRDAMRPIEAKPPKPKHPKAPKHKPAKPQHHPH